MTYTGTPQMNHHYRESEAVLLYDAKEASRPDGEGASVLLTRFVTGRSTIDSIVWAPQAGKFRGLLLLRR